MKPISDFDLGWVVGFLEGEGSFTTSARSGPYRKPGAVQLRVQACSTDRDSLERLASIVGGGVTGPYLDPRGNRRPLYRWGVAGRDDAIALMGRLRPYLSERRQRQVVEARERATLQS